MGVAITAIFKESFRTQFYPILHGRVNNSHAFLDLHSRKAINNSIRAKVFAAFAPMHVHTKERQKICEINENT